MTHMDENYFIYSANSSCTLFIHDRRSYGNNIYGSPFTDVPFGNLPDLHTCISI